MIEKLDKFSYAMSVEIASKSGKPDRRTMVSAEFRTKTEDGKEKVHVIRQPADEFFKFLENFHQVLDSATNNL
ncbi:unnamed protein product [Bursaphelenchus xylophilus]|uniref:(pine wood nematode) hypothetical protein n=1 Tax=Bursaphelenchus xylophilus TaxID=6326 RepID=A0A1I7S7U8_BURXY|nr:unnamed protein product [Bursaphelenchus xylophilus]CAG9087042.1 unnamed protein product [Bursaphelenchus xylophilus]